MVSATWRSLGDTDVHFAATATVFFPPKSPPYKVVTSISPAKEREPCVFWARNAGEGEGGREEAGIRNLLTWPWPALAWPGCPAHNSSRWTF